MANNIDVKLLLDIKDATESVASFTSGLKALAATAAAAFAGAKIAGFIGDIVSESSKAEAGIADLNNALALAGNFSAEASKDFQDFASELQSTTKFSDDAVISAGALIEQLTRLDEQGLKQATQAAIDLSAALRIDLDSASRLVGKAAEGNISAFSRYGIEIQKGASDAETFANTLSVLQSRFGGAAAAQVNTFSGAMEVLSNTISDVKEALGDIITQNPAVIAGIKAVSGIFQIILKSIEQNKNSIIAYVRDGVLYLLSLLPSLLNVIRFLNDAFVGLKSAIQLAIVPFRALIDVALAAKSLAIGDLAGAKESIRNAKEVAQASLDGVNATVEAGAAREDALLGIKTASQEVINKTIEQIKLDDFASKKYVAGIENKIAAIKKLSEEEQKSNIDKLSKNPTLAITGGGGLVGGGDSTQEGIAAGAGGIASVLQGMAGATKLASGLVSNIADTLLPGIGAVAGQIFEVFAQGPEKVKAMIDQFFQAIPTIIAGFIQGAGQFVVSLIENIPVLILGLIEQIPILITYLAETLPTALDAALQRLSNPETIQQIVSALSAAIPQVALALQIQMPLIATRFAISLAAQAPFIAINFWIAMVKEIPTFVRLVGEGIRDAIKSVTNVGNVLGEKGGGGVRGLLGFADGGTVPAGFPNDSFPARLTSGEEVLNTGLSQKLAQFLSGQGGGAGQNVTVNLVIGEQELASVLLNLNQKGFRTI